MRGTSRVANDGRGTTDRRPSIIPRSGGASEDVLDGEVTTRVV